MDVIESIGRVAIALRKSLPEADFPLAASSLLEREVEHLQAYSSLIYAKGRTYIENAISSYSFSDLPLTLFDTDGIRIDLYHWNTRTIGIHSHGFVGAFVVLSGASLDIAYSFDVVKTLDGHLELGKLRAKSAKIVHAGEALPIPAFEQFIHNNWHYHLPCATMVIRSATSGNGRSLSRRYTAPGLSVPSNAIGGLDKTLRLIKHLQEKGGTLLTRYIEQNREAYSLSEWVWIIAALSKSNVGDDFVRSRCSEIFGNDADMIVDCIASQKAMSELAKLRDFLMTDKEMGLFLALIVFSPPRQVVSDVIEQFGPGRPTNQVMARWLTKFASRVDVGTDVQYGSTLRELDDFDRCRTLGRASSKLVSSAFTGRMLREFLGLS